MALNCSMITPNNDPVPLPGEKIFISVKAVTIYVNPTRPGAGTTSETPVSPTGGPSAASHDPKQKGKLSLSGMLAAISLAPADDGSANGTVYVTNQRILFIADNASILGDDLGADHDNPRSSTGGGQSAPLPPIKTLTVPLRNSFDGRFIQPWLSANYHLSTFVPVPHGNIDQVLPPPSSTQTNSHHYAQDSFTLKIVFNEGHGFEFTEALEEVKNIMFQSESLRPAELEELPTYSPPMGDPAPLATASSYVRDPQYMETSAGAGDAPPAIDGYHFSRRETLPEADLLLAASIATEEELQEREIVTEEPPIASLAHAHLPLPAPAPSAAPPGSDAPPGYEP
ncbi:hypothetical protein PCANC_14037 [Puccinia coronata f. sp. avenae]|uniref:GRAM domain-containing protein n=1 Tax=Puccinia coronata f. sp. avenae TaxID=200324 RepID=A0A2N5VRM1_9BASI|nr:hypothetical protein PCANC_24066 [Puccinia coronata f. sp. avenae]PLW21822.1 hypothetical protein PCASD_20280 [Puccinia coronata f. sp. avenae]PLW52610.1 hypothetical protein PCANC_14037 [Puccinia coronata f. sp. avenae]